MSDDGPYAGRFEELWQQHAGRVLLYASRHVGADAAEDVLAETFLVAWRRLAHVPGSALPWLLVVARNTIANQRRSQYRRRALTEEIERLVSTAPAATSAETSAVERLGVLHALVALSTREREALLLVAWDGLSTQDAARVAGCSPTAFTTRLSRARAHLRDAVPEPVPSAPPPISRPRLDRSPTAITKEA